MPSVTLRGIDMYFEASGAGPALALLPGLGMSIPQWGGFPGMLTGALRVITMDQRGLGQSARGEGALSLKVALTVRYDGEPPAGVKDLDTAVTNRLAWDF